MALFEEIGYIVWRKSPFDVRRVTADAVDGIVYKTQICVTVGGKSSEKIVSMSKEDTSNISDSEI